MELFRDFCLIPKLTELLQKSSFFEHVIMTNIYFFRFNEYITVRHAWHTVKETLPPRLNVQPICLNLTGAFAKSNSLAKLMGSWTGNRLATQEILMMMRVTAMLEKQWPAVCVIVPKPVRILRNGRGTVPCSLRHPNIFLRRKLPYSTLTSRWSLLYRHRLQSAS